MARRSNWLALGLTVTAVACGSSNERDLFGNNGGSAGGGAAGSSGSAGVGGAGASGTGGVSGVGGSSASGGSAGVGGDGATGGVGGSSGASGTGGSSVGGSGGVGGDAGFGGVGGDAGFGGVGGDAGFGGVGGDAGFGGAGGVSGFGGAGGVSGFGGAGGVSGFGGSGASSGMGYVDCVGHDDCNLATDFCCVMLNSTIWTPICQTNGKACTPGVDVTCDGPEDCGAGQVCCGQQGSFNGQTVYAYFQCQAASTCNVNEGERVICGDQPNVCLGGTICKPSTVLPGYNVCATN